MIMNEPNEDKNYDESTRIRIDMDQVCDIALKGSGGHMYLWDLE